LFDDTLSLCRRARFARHKATEPEWWTSRLAGAPDARRSLITLALCAIWANTDAIRENVKYLNESIAALDPQQYAWLVSVAWFAGYLLDATGGRRKRIRGVWADELPTARLFALLQPRRQGRDDAETYALASFDLEQSDPHVVRAFLAYELEKVNGRPQSWERTLSLLRRAELHCVSERFVAEIRSRKFASMPLAVAERIVRAPEEYPLTAVARAESRRLQDAIATHPTVGAVAQRDGWF
jgi:hypothetical protein